MKNIRIILSNLWKIYVGIVFLLTLLLFYPLLFVVLQFDSLNFFSFRINVCWSRMVRILCFYAVDKQGSIPKSREPKIIVANHTSYLDIFLLYSCLPQQPFIFLGKSEILKYPLIKTFFKKLNIPVDRSNRVKAARAIVRAREALNNGWSIVIFPEGGIFDDAPQLHSFKNGAFQLAKTTKAPILPISYINNYKLLSDPETPTGLAMPGVSHIYFHDLISVQDIEQRTIQELNTAAFNTIKSKLEGQKED